MSASTVAYDGNVVPIRNPGAEAVVLVGRPRTSPFSRQADVNGNDRIPLGGKKARRPRVEGAYAAGRETPRGTA